jgi:hypothetical protein
MSPRVRLAQKLALGFSALLAASVALGVPGAEARVDVAIGVGVPGFYAPPVVVAPPPVYYAPPPYYYAPGPAYYYAPGPYYGGGYWWFDDEGRRHWHRH